jgi:hypothetical protein
MAGTLPKRKDRHLSFLLFIVPFVLWLFPPFYNYIEPKLLDIPFFYWFQALWVINTALILAVVYFLGG